MALTCQSALRGVCPVSGRSVASLVLPIKDVTRRWGRRAKPLGFGQVHVDIDSVPERMLAVCGT